MAVVSCFFWHFGFEIFLVEVDFRKNKWLLNCSYNLKSRYIESYLNFLPTSIDSHSSKYQGIILLRYFNSCMLDSSRKAFCETYEFRSLVKKLQKPTEFIMYWSDFEKQLCKFSAVVYNRDRVIWLSKNGTDCHENTIP